MEGEGAQPVSPYEKQRRERMSRNSTMMKKLNIEGAREELRGAAYLHENQEYLLGGDPSFLDSSADRENDMGFANRAALVRQKKVSAKKRKRKTAGDAKGAEGDAAASKGAALLPSRKSSRLRGEKPAGAGAEGTSDDPARALEAAEARPAARGRGGARPRLELRLLHEGHKMEAPFTLKSCGVTVWSLGEIHREEWSFKYWSSKGCLFHHAYPVGYRATKCHFNKVYEMWIEKGKFGPIFAVKEVGKDLVFRGESPTKPWTKVCLHQRTGARISGPLHFGFSDPATQSAICAMYNATELAAAKEGSRAWNEVLSPQEKAAKDFMEMEGVGETAAMVLASTSSLGGAPHRSRKSLALWAARDEGAALKKFLVESTELPHNLRRWPAWRAKFVPRIIEALIG